MPSDISKEVKTEEVEPKEEIKEEAKVINDEQIKDMLLMELELI